MASFATNTPAAAGPLLSKTQFAAWAQKNGRPAASYSNYVNYVTKTRTARATAGSGTASSPYGAQNYGQLIGAAGRLYGSPYTNAQTQSMAGADIHALVDPVLDRINADYTSRANAGASAIQAVTDQYAKRLAPYQSQMGDIFDSAQGKIAALNSALGGTSGAIDHGTSQGLTDQYNALGITGAGTGGLAASAAGNAQASNTSAAESLIGTGAGYEGYAKLLPAFADLTGINNIGTFRSGLEQQRSAEVGSVTDALPGMIQSATQNYQNISEGRRQNAGSFISQGLDRYQQAAQAAAALHENASEFYQNLNQGYSQIAAGNAGKTGKMPWSDAATLSNLEANVLPQYINKVQNIAGQSVVTHKDWATAYHDAAQGLKRLYPNAPANWINSELRQELPTLGIKQPTAPKATGQVKPTNQSHYQNPNDANANKPAQPTPKPAGHPQAVWQANGPSGPGWYEPHKTQQGGGGRVGTATVYVKVK